MNWRLRSWKDIAGVVAVVVEVTPYVFIDYPGRDFPDAHTLSR